MATPPPAVDAVVTEPRPGGDRSTGDRGAGLIGTISGFVVFLALMLFAVQTLTALYTRSVVTDAAHDGVRRVAGIRGHDGGSHRATHADAEAHVRALLGDLGDRVRLDWSASTDEVVVLRVQVEPTSFVWQSMRGPWSSLVDRTVTARVEGPR